ncbi:MAG: hypothetical protein Unbinned4264contig1000_2 [Prokaryotic dsDNA virus sp.]|nr:MAG: hypothetical protein Unbinned4264contig1000_2 [Prokaryotic dsDNA virus sp.]|tara:strand:+ start:743 stop:1111 length:369 start_codon:yes stop_codon:yes gene_type:complete
MTEERYLAIHDINTFQSHENEVYLRGKDHHGEDITLVFNAFELLEWLHIDEIRASVLKYVNEINKEEHPDIKALKDVDKVIENIEKHWEEEDEEEIQYSCCGDEITGVLEDIQMCPTCKEHL